MAFQACLLIPVYEHAEPLKAVLAGLKPLGRPCLLVDDGSSEACAQALRGLAAANGDWVQLKRLEQNQGKGGAVQAGLRWAAALGYSHALQVDADGQHDLSALPGLLAAAEAEPNAAICAAPRFDASAPASRLAGRRLTNFWIAVNTLSRAIPDGMCGLRVYPLAATLPLLNAWGLGRRMDFDPEILVRLAWAGVPLRFQAVDVHYPEGGRSNFRAFKDNALISAMHTRLFFGMLLRLPLLLWRRRS
jgi:glycosyltransferase involved in cell wall biosynthesis